MIPFPFKENRFSFFLFSFFFFFFFFFFFVADHLQVSQLCTNPKSDRSLLSCLKVTQCSTSEIRDAPLYNPCSLPIQVMTTGPLPAPSKCKSGRFNVPRVKKIKFPTTVMVFGVVSSEYHIIPPHRLFTHLLFWSIRQFALKIHYPISRLVQSVSRNIFYLSWL